MHKSLRAPPVMQAGLFKRITNIEDIATLVADKTSRKRGCCKRKISE